MKLPLHNSLGGMVANWRFEESSAPFKSSIGSGKVLIDNGTPVGSTSSGFFRNAALMSGTDYTQFLINTDLRMGDAWTIGCWFNVLSTTNAGNQSGSNYPCLWTTLTAGGATDVTLVLYDSRPLQGGWVYDRTNVANYGQFQNWMSPGWNHVVVSCSAIGFYFYWQGALIASVASAFRRPFYGIQVGSQPTTLAVANVAIDQLTVWNRQVTTEFVTQQYNSGAGKYL